MKKAIESKFCSACGEKIIPLVFTVWCFVIAFFLGLYVPLQSELLKIVSKTDLFGKKIEKIGDRHGSGACHLRLSNKSAGSG